MRKAASRFVRYALAAALVVGTSPLRAQQVTQASPQIALIPNYTANGGLPHWQACRANIIANTGNCTILIIDASTGSGRGSTFNADASDAHSGAYANWLAAWLTQAGISASANGFFGNNAVGTTAANYEAYDTRVTQNGSSAWVPCAAPSCINGVTFGNEVWTNGDTSSGLIFNPTDTASYPSTPSISTDKLDVFYFTDSSAHHIAVTVGGTNICTIDVQGSPSSSLAKTTCSATLGANSYQLVGDAAFDINFLGVHARNSTVSEASIYNGSIEGALSTTWTNSTSSNSDPIPTIKAFAPTLCIVGGMDDSTTADATYIANLTAIVDACQITGDALLMTPTTSATSGGDSPEYPNDVKTVGVNTNSPVFDLWSFLGGANGAQWLQPVAGNGGCCGNAVDTAHYSVGMQAQEGLILSQILRQ